ncbi:disintegrin and metalloproteinase domain-containing protein 21-like [Eulemur rufifrons]|uniref:disintegrin and metalloproteinase domain-containing protein 21-like n=1 Tax=Eulemur rufifrons TaxID=859984 RepID=UPI003744AB73
MNSPELGREAGRGTGALRAPLVLLGLWALLASAQGSQGRPSWRYVSSEVVIPRKETHRGKGFQVPGWLAYSLRFGGQRHVIHLRPKKLLMPKHLLVTTQNDQGALQMDYPYVPADCHYLGYLEEIPLSMVTVDTCYGGLDGVMKLDDLAYEIKPLKDSHSFEHVVSQIVADHNAIGPMYKLERKEDADTLFSKVNPSAAPRTSLMKFASHQSSFRSQAQISKSMYDVFANFSACIQFIIRLYSVTDTLLHGLHSSFFLLLVTLYTQRDPAPMNDYRVPGSEMFNYYRQTFSRWMVIVSSLLIIKEAPTDDQVDPPVRALCFGSNLHHVGYLGRHYLMLAIVVNNRVMRNFGMSYDGPQCYCLRRTQCIMWKFPGLTDAYSNCSIVSFQNVVVSGQGDCIFYLPISSLNRSLVEARCGNSVVDPEEQCDCGSLKQCYSSQCCKSDCKLTPQSTCHMGSCCTNCTFSAAGTLCRPIQNICDLPEYCSGFTTSCPPNMYMQDGTPCTQEGYCYTGNCTDPSMHCKEIFGSSAENANEVCYNLNLGKSRFGHCARQNQLMYFSACSKQDKFCGRLQCANVTHLPRLHEHVSFHQSIISGFPCFGLDEHRSMGTTDVGRVRNGTPCAPGKFCLNYRCSGTVKDLNYDCDPQKCSRRGLCNNKRNCHCHVGWDPPLCLKAGSGGSVDSGAPPKRMRLVTPSEESVLYLRVAFARMYALIVALLFGVATNVRVIKTTTAQEKTYPGPKGQ